MIKLNNNNIILKIIISSLKIELIFACLYKMTKLVSSLGFLIVTYIIFYLFIYFFCDEVKITMAVPKPFKINYFC